MTAPLQAFILSQPGLVAYWPLGEASGDALDGSANSNDGAVTIGAGARAEPALDVGGDGSLLFDGAATKVTVPDHSTIQDIFDGGGAFFFMFDADSDGELDAGRVVAKGPSGGEWEIRVQDEAAGFVRLAFKVNWDGTDGLWVTSVDIPRNTTIAGVLDYNADAVMNFPTLYLGDGTLLTTRTVEVGFTESTRPVGTRVSDSGHPLTFGNLVSGAVTFDGHLDELALFDATLPAAKALKMITLALEGASAGLVRGGGGSQTPSVGHVTVRTLH